MQQTEVRTETERHWDNLAITTIAVATAATAAVFFIMRENLQGVEPAGDLELFSSVMGLSASTLYLTATGIAGTGIFGGIHLGGDRRAQWKRHRTHEAFAAFWTILVATAIMAFTTFTLPTIQSWYRELA